MTYTDGFDTDAFADELAYAFALFVALMALWEVVQSVASTDGDAPRRRQTEQSVSLNEDVLRRLENGETVVVQRWHGHDLELAGTQVIDADVIEDETED